MEKEVELSKVLSFPVILLIAINSIMGTGIFFLPAYGASQAGPASLISWILISLIAIYISMCFAELASMFPLAGGVYEYCKQAFGRFPSFLIGWMTILAGNITIAMLIVGAIIYLIPGGASTLKAQAIVVGISILFILIFNYIAYRGMKLSSIMLLTFSVITLCTLGLLIFPGFLKLNFQNFNPFFVFPTSSIFITMFLIAETFFGWETITFLAEETKNASRVMPKALIYSTVIIAIVSLLFVIVTLGVIPVSGWEDFPVSRPLVNLAVSIGYSDIVSDIITLMVYLSIIGSVAGWIVSAPRLILALCRDKVFPRHFIDLHPIHGTPHKAILLQTIFSCLLIIIGIGAYLTLLELLLPIALLLYTLVIISLIVLRIKKPQLERPYKQPLGLFGPICLALILLGLIINWILQSDHGINSIILVGALILVGIPLYLLIEMYYDPRAIRKVKDLLAYLTYFTEFIFIPKFIIHRAIFLLGDIKDKRILEFGCSVGTLTSHLSKAMGENGRLYASDISLTELNLTKNRLKKEKLTNVRLIHDELHTTRVNPIIPNLEGVISLGMLSYVQDVQKVLKELNHRLNPNAHFCFVDYGKFFHLIPNIEWIGDDELIRKYFRIAGFSVSIERKKSLIFEYVFIHGIKHKNLNYV